MSNERVLLVEFAALGRFILATEFPFVNAWLKRVGVPVTWLRFALEPAVQFARQESGIGLTAPDLATLEHHVRLSGATRVLLDQQPSPEVLARIRAAGPGVDLRVLARGGDLGNHWRADAGRTMSPQPAALAAWLDLDGLDCATGVVETEGRPPDFGFIPANDAARRMEPLGFIVTGAECVYQRSVVGRPEYREVDLTGCRTTGCAFCATGGSGRAAPGAVAGRVLEQVAAFLSTYPFPVADARARLRLPGQLVLREVEEVAAALQARSGPGLDLLLDARTDHILQQEARLGNAVRLLEETPHRIHICLVGVESFSRAELERMNKGVEPWQNLAAIRVLRDLERRHPGSFGFREHGGLSTILYTPWTTLGDLGLNLAVARHFALAPYLGKLLHSRLRLYEGLPMTALARHDGLLVEAYDDPALDTARRNFYPDEIPWRFRDPRVEPINRITTRMNSDSALAKDALYRRVQDWCHGQDALELTAQIVARAAATPAVLEVEELMAAPPVEPPLGTPPPAAEPREAPGVDASPAALPGGGLGDASRPPMSPPTVTGASPSGDAGPFTDIAPLVVLQRAGLNRANRLEGLSRERATAVIDWLRSAPLEVEAVERTVSVGTTVDVFFGPRSGDVREAVELTNVQYRGQSQESVVRARRRLGELYGYPSCCAESFSRVECARPTVNEWLILRRRCQSPGPISPLLSPFGSVAMQYVPCSFQCEASLGRLARVAEVFEAQLGPAARAGLARRSELPVIFLLDRPGASLQLTPLGPVGRAFEFAAGPCDSADPRLRAIAGGGRLEIDEGLLVVTRAGCQVAAFVLDAALFWHGAAFDAAFWLEVAREALEPAAIQQASGAERPGTSPGHTPGGGRHGAVPAAVARLATRLRRVLLAPGPASLGTYRVAAVRPTHDRSVTVVLHVADGGQGSPIELYVEPLQGARRYHVVAGPLAITRAPRTPLATRGQREAVAALASLLASASEEPAR